MSESIPEPGDTWRDEHGGDVTVLTVGPTMAYGGPCSRCKGLGVPHVVFTEAKGNTNGACGDSFRADRRYRFVRHGEEKAKPEAGRFPPLKGDVWGWEKQEWEFDGTSVEYRSAIVNQGSAYQCRGSGGVSGQWYRQQFTDGTLTFVRYGTAPAIANVPPVTPTNPPQPPAKPAPRQRETYASLRARLDADEGVPPASPLPVCNECGTRAHLGYGRKCMKCHREDDARTGSRMMVRDASEGRVVAPAPTPYVSTVDPLHWLPSPTEFGTRTPK